MKYKKWKLITLTLLIVSIVTFISISYNKKVQRENLLSKQLEELNNQFNNIEILNMNKEEEKLYNDLKSKFNNSLNKRDINVSKDIYGEILTKCL